MKKLLKILVSLLLFIASLLSMHNEAVNGHYHITENGSTFYHVHPYAHNHNNSPFKNHTHTKIESVIYLSYTHPLFLLPLLLSLVVKLATVLAYNNSNNIFTFSLQEAFESHKLRAPPIVL